MLRIQFVEVLIDSLASLETEHRGVLGVGNRAANSSTPVVGFDRLLGAHSPLSNQGLDIWTAQQACLWYSEAMRRVSHRFAVPALLVLSVVPALILFFFARNFQQQFGAVIPHRSRVADTPASSNDPVVLAAGDIANCSNDHDAATASLIKAQTGTVLALGDTVYEKGSTKNYTECYDPTWGQFKDRTYPAIGNHEYETKSAAGYFSYFGSKAGTPGQGWYSFDVGAWHLIALNSNCSKVGCDDSSTQMQWLQDDLTKHSNTCTLVYFHHPVYSSGFHGTTKALQPFWKTFVKNNVDLVLSGHDHDYERFAPQGNDGVSDPAGVRQFVVGTGGRSLYPLIRNVPNSEISDASSYGVLKLTLHDKSYDWQFLPSENGTLVDSGTGECH